MRIVFMGTPDFAVASLDAIVKAGFDVAAVITATDKPAGRGKKIQFSAVKSYALENSIETILQPEKLKNEEFLVQLRAINADLFVVVAFRMLPEVVWSMPPKGTINLHASLLPQYRGAAPINWAVINGDTETGVSTFFIQQEIDTGKVIMQEKISISEFDNAGTVHDKLMDIGAETLVKTICKIEAGDIQPIEQSEMLETMELKPAPKIFKEDCMIDWNQPAVKVFNHIRGLSPYPGAFSILATDKEYNLKVFETEYEIKSHDLEPGTVQTNGKNDFSVAVNDGFIKITELQIAGKKRMKTGDFLRGFSVEGGKFSL